MGLRDPGLLPIKYFACALSSSGHYSTAYDLHVHSPLCVSGRAGGGGEFNILAPPTTVLKVCSPHTSGCLKYHTSL